MTSHNNYHANYKNRGHSTVYIIYKGEGNTKQHLKYRTSFINESLLYSLSLGHAIRTAPCQCMAVSSTLIGGAYEPLKTKNLNDKEVINMLDTTKIYHSKHSGDFKILKYTNSAFVLIEFIDTKYQAIVTAGNIRLGKVRDHVLGMSEEAAAIKLRAKQVAAIAAVEALKPTPEEIEEIIEQVMPVEESHPDFWALETSAHIVQFFQARKSYCRVHSGLARV